MPELWPREFRLTCEATFGGSLNRTTYDVVARRVEHAFTVWRRRYQMTPAQETYGWELLSWAVRNAGMSMREQGEKVRHPYIYLRRAVSSQMEKVVHSEDAHEGFKRRAELVDVSGHLREALA